jgi:hypothetical protein
MMILVMRDVRHAHNTPHTLSHKHKLCTHTRLHAYTELVRRAVETRTKHLAPLCKRDPSRLERPVEEVVDERPTTWAGWERES